MIQNAPKQRFYHLVPKDPEENITWRKLWFAKGRNSKATAELIHRMCREDLLFYINGFCTLFEPRNAKVLPFITYPFQDEALLDIAGCFGEFDAPWAEFLDIHGPCDLVIEKSRDMGASWMCATVFEWFWHFWGRATFLILSRKEELVDKKGDPKSLFWKIDFIHRYQPKWFKPRFERMKMHKANLETGASIDGESTNEYAGVADRRLGLLLDEFSLVENHDSIFAGTRDVTDSRIFNFTPQGVGNTACKIAHDPKFRKITLHWSKHPVKAKGLYRIVNGKVELLDKDYWNHDKVSRYQFRTEPPNNLRFNYRSPWYDAQCDRVLDSRQIAQMLDIDYEASDYQYYDPKVIKRMLDEEVRLPYLRGEIEFEHHSGLPIGFHSNPKGRLRLWTYLSQEQPSHETHYTVGADISAGTGSSNSVISVLDNLTREQVAEWVSPNVRPDELAKIAVAICKWFRGPTGEGAHLIWEANGPGREFGDVVLEMDYMNIYYRKQDKSIKKKVTDFPGWYATRETIEAVHGLHRREMARGGYIPRSREQVEECSEYIFTMASGIQHTKSVHSKDPSGARLNHGDRPRAAALCVEAGTTPPIVEQKEPVVPSGSIMYRRNQAEAKRRDGRYLL